MSKMLNDVPISFSALAACAAQEDDVLLHIRAGKPNDVVTGKTSVS